VSNSNVVLDSNEPAHQVRSSLMYGRPRRGDSLSVVVLTTRPPQVLAIDGEPFFNARSLLLADDYAQGFLSSRRLQSSHRPSRWSEK
jgi:hypothetical protein